MNEVQALILGFIQGLTEYLPVSSSGHLELGKILLGPEAEAGGLTFDIVVHVATVLSTLVVLWKEVAWIFTGMFRWDGKMNDEQKYVVNILISMIPVGIVGLFFKDQIEALFAGEVIKVVGCCLLVIGIAQAIAVLPGLSRSGSTIATGLLLGNSKKNLAQFSFLMVIPPILGEAILDFKHIFAPSQEYLATHAIGAPIPTTSLIVGFVAAFISGCFACKWMIALVKKCKLYYFAIYCAIVGIIALCC